MSMPSSTNALILKPGRPIRDRMQDAARQWLAGGRSSGLLPTGLAFFTAQSWLYSSGSYKPESPGFNPDVCDFVAAAKEALGGDAGWKAMLHEKAFCSHCHMSFHLENIGICTGCMEYVCGACRVQHGDCVGEIVG